MKEVPVYPNLVALVDDEDFDFVSRSVWHSKSHMGAKLVYAATNVAPWGEKIYTKMHRLILSAPKGFFVDHINGNGLDNQRSNLRLCTITENARNRRKHNGRSLFKGVHPRPSGRWQAVICANYKLRWLGTYDTEIEAARAYDRAALDAYGKFAKTNFEARP